MCESVNTAGIESGRMYDLFKSLLAYAVTLLVEMHALVDTVTFFLAAVRVLLDEGIAFDTAELTYTSVKN